MEMHQVRYFLAVARMLNFTRAAEECHVAQPSLTRAIKQLEEEFGGDLFRRERNLSHLTEFGQRMLPFLQQVYDSAQAAKSLATSLKSGGVVPLAVGLSMSIDPLLIIGFLTELARVFEGLELRIIRASATEIGEALKKGEIEVAISGPLGEEWGRLDSWLLFAESMAVAVGSKSPLAGTTSVKHSELASHNYIKRAHCEHCAEFEDVLHEHQAKLAYRHSVGSDRDCLALLAGGLGISIVPASMRHSADIRLLPLEGVNLQRRVLCYTVAGRQRHTAATTLVKMLRAADWNEQLKTVEVPLDSR